MLVVFLLPEIGRTLVSEDRRQKTLPLDGVPSEHSRQGRPSRVGSRGFKLSPSCPGSGLSRH